MIIAVLIVYIFNVLENYKISHVIKYTILIGRNWLFNYIAQSNYCIIEIVNHSFLKNNIEKKTVASLIKL